jgi:ribose transport system ATP-binding protein
VLVADTLEEAIGLSHSIIIVKDGEIQKRFECAPGAKPTPYDLLHYMI